MVKTGLIGLGYLGKIHLQLLREVEGIKLIGVYDIDTELCTNLASQYNIKAFNDLTEMIAECDAVDIVTPSNSHFEIASECIKKKKHVFIEKPATSSVEESRQLLQLGQKTNVCIQIGHVERFNPAFIAAKPYIRNPQYIGFQRYANYNPRGTDVSVTLDLMIHDLDLLISTVKSPIKQIEANGIVLVSKSHDIANARIEFENGCIATVSANRIASHNIRKLTVYQADKIIEIDLLNKNTTVSHILNADSESKGKILVPGNGIPNKEIITESLLILPTNAIKEELSSFINSIITAQKPVVTIEDAIDVLSLAYSIDKKILQSIS